MTDKPRPKPLKPARSKPKQVYRSSRKGKNGACKVCTHPGRKEIDAMLLNVAAAVPIAYNTIIAAMKRNHPKANEITKSNLTRHKQLHLLNNPVTREVVSEDGTKTIQTYITGHYEAQNIQIPSEAVPKIPSIPDSLKIIVAAALHNALNNPALVTVKDGLEALKLLKQLGSNADDIEKYLGSWESVEARKTAMKKTAKRTRSVTLTEEVEVPAPEPVLLPADATPVPGYELTAEDLEWLGADLLSDAPVEGVIDVSRTETDDPV